MLKNDCNKKSATSHMWKWEFGNTISDMMVAYEKLLKLN
jgi:hypothetical protein